MSVFKQLIPQSPDTLFICRRRCILVDGVVAAAAGSRRLVVLLEDAVAPIWLTLRRTHFGALLSLCPSICTMDLGPKLQLLSANRSQEIILNLFSLSLYVLTN